MKDFERIKKEYDAWKCVKCNKDEGIVGVKSPSGDIILCLYCLSVERSTPAPKEQDRTELPKDPK